MSFAEVEHKSRFGLWVEAEGQNRPFESKKNYDVFLELSGETPFTDLYCQVYRNGRSYFPSIVADDSPYRTALTAGFDPLKDTITRAHLRGQKVHAWINVLKIIDNRDAPLLSVIGREAATVDSYGNSILDYSKDGLAPGKYSKLFRLGTPGIWLEPSDAQVRNYIVETIRDVIVAYPELDGIHLDMVRYPLTMRYRRSKRRARRPRFGYSSEAISRFYEFARLPSPKRSNKLVRQLLEQEAWQAWQRAQITLLVAEIRELITDIAPRLELSAAVIASPYRSYNEVFQDWGIWLEKGLIDHTVLMSYTRSNEMVRSQAKHALKVAGDRQVIVGLGAWLMLKNHRRLLEQGKIAQEIGAHGVTLFSYSNLLSKNGRKLIKKFRKAIFPKLKFPPPPVVEHELVDQVPIPILGPAPPPGVSDRPIDKEG